MDYWSLGIILNEFLIGATPFYGENAGELFQMVLEGKCDQSIILLWESEITCQILNLSNLMIMGLDLSFLDMV